MNLRTTFPFIIQRNNPVAGLVNSFVPNSTRLNVFSGRYSQQIIIPEFRYTLAVNSQMSVEISVLVVDYPELGNNVIPSGINVIFRSGSGQSYVTSDGEGGQNRVSVGRDKIFPPGYILISINNTDSVNAQPALVEIDVERPA